MLLVCFYMNSAQILDEHFHNLTLMLSQIVVHRFNGRLRGEREVVVGTKITSQKLKEQFWLVHDYLYACMYVCMYTDII